MHMKQSYFIKKLSALLLVVAGLALSLSQGMAAEPLALHMLLTDGTTRIFKFANAPEVTFAGDKLTVTSAQDAITVDIDNVQEFHFGDIPTDIDEVGEVARTIINVADGEVLVHNAALSNVGVFDIDGHKLSPSVRQQSDGISISLRSLPAGVYIIRINDQSLKVTKR